MVKVYKYKISIKFFPLCLLYHFWLNLSWTFEDREVFTGIHFGRMSGKSIFFFSPAFFEGVAAFHTFELYFTESQINQYLAPCHETAVFYEMKSWCPYNKILKIIYWRRIINV